jgi:hypothetical protein
VLHPHGTVSENDWMMNLPALTDNRIPVSLFDDLHVDKKKRMI